MTALIVFDESEIDGAFTYLTTTSPEPPAPPAVR